MTYHTVTRVSVKRIGFIVNPKAGIKKSAYEDIKSLIGRVFDEKFHTEIHLTRGAGDATSIAEHFVQDNFDVVAAVGGDGTVNETARGLIGSATSLAIIPYGSGNGLARGLTIPMNKEKAMETIRNGLVRAIDIGEVTDGMQRRLFVGFSGMGYDAFIGKLFNERGGRRGLFSYVYLSILSYPKFKTVALRIKVNGKEIYTDPFLLAVANTEEYGNGARIAPNAEPDDGLFELCILQDMTLIKGLLNGWRLFNGTIDRVEGTVMMRAKEIEVIPESEIYYHVDGESFATSNALTFTFLPSRLNIMVPS